MKYHHISALVNSQIKDILISEAEYADCESITDYFTADAIEVTDQGIVNLDTENFGHVLPDIIGD